MEESDDDTISVGPPSVNEIRDCLLNRGIWKSINSRDSTSSTDSSDLNDSFKKFLNRRLQNINANNMNDNDSNYIGNTTDINVLGGDETFAEIEKRMSESSFDEFEDSLECINDIAEPSGLWEISLNNLQKMSPVKLCGLLRPSTIIEEDSLDFSSKVSSSVTSSVSTNALVEILENKDDKQNIDGSFITAKNSDSTSKSQDESFLTARTENTGVKLNTDRKSTSSSNCSNSSKNVFQWNTKNNRQIFCDENRKSKSILNDISQSAEVIADTSLSPEKNEVIELSSDDSSEEISKYTVANTLNSINSSLLDESSISIGTNKKRLKHSIEFNDSLEEMEYMMNKGLQLMMQEKNVLTPMAVKAAETIKNTKPVSPFYLETPSTVKKLTDSSFSTWTKEPQHFDYNLNTFKKPTPAKIPQLRSLKKPTYDYIGSPIGAYIRNTPITPLTTHNKDHDIYNSKLSQMKDSSSSEGISNMQNYKENSGKKIYSKPLPRKAYISAGSNYVIDERQYTKIPGGDKVQRLFGSHKSPTVTKHVGRFKRNDPANCKSPITRRTALFDESFNDLSVVSGDVSVHVIKNANKN